MLHNENRKDRDYEKTNCKHFDRGGGGRAQQAFTMAEILLSLTIIGVVAAITLPSLTGNINERTWNTQRKALYARMSQAIALMPALNGYGTLVEGNDSTSAQDTATETFLTDGLAKVLKINNICDNTHLEDCGVVTSFTNMAGSQTSMPTTLYELSFGFRRLVYFGSSYSTMDTKTAAFETQNGESIVTFYNQSCRTEYRDSLDSNGNVFSFLHPNMCVNFIYDLNGNKGPNTVGKDIGFITVFNATDSSVVAPMPSSANNAGRYSWYDAAKACTTLDPETRIPNIDELFAMLINRDLINLTSSYSPLPYFRSGSVSGPGESWVVGMANGVLVRISTSHHLVNNVRCIKR